MCDKSIAKQAPPHSPTTVHTHVLFEVKPAGLDWHGEPASEPCPPSPDPLCSAFARPFQLSWTLYLEKNEKI